MTQPSRPPGGVKAPPVVILPDPATRFARTAKRLDALSAGHPLAVWLSFVARVAEAQQGVTATMAVAARPFLDAQSHQRASVWRDGLVTLLDRLGAEALPEAARTAMAHLRERGAARMEVLADAFLGRTVDRADAAEAFFVAAALQVYFTRLAASVPLSSLALRDDRGLCPCCGTAPVTGIVTQSDGRLGARYLHCALCATAWNHTRTICITCGQSGGLALQEIEGDGGLAKAETCNDCRTYSKLLYEARDTRLDPVADDLATLALDLLVTDAGWSRHAPNPLLLVT